MESFIDKLRRRATGIIPEDNFMDSDLMPPQVNEQGVVPNPSYERKESPLVNPQVDPFNNFQKKQPMSTMDMKQNEYAKQGMQKFGLGEKQFQNIFGISYSQAGQSWKDKGGFEGLMSNPAFTLGLGLMKSSATGQPISQSLFDNALKAGAISGQYAERIKARSELTGPITDEQRDEVRSVLAESDIFEGSVGQKFKNFFTGKNTEALNRRALDDIYKEAEKIAMKRAGSRGGKKARIEREDIEKATRSLKSSGKLDVSEKGLMSFFFGRGIQSKKPGLAKGGPAKEGKEYIVGEEGPEMFVPQVDGNVIDNDDTKVVNMLLESNPQLKNISRARAVKILKNRFPDYF